VRRLLEKENDAVLLEKLKYEHRTQTHKVWMDGFNDIWLEKRELVETKIHYIHNNPLQPHWALVDKPSDYPYSSAGFYYLENQDWWV
jgi:putative transposase